MCKVAPRGGFLPVVKKKLLKLVPPAENPGFLVQALVELHKAVKGAGFYPKGHPYRIETLQRAYDCLKKLVSDRELVLGVNRQGFLLVGEPVEGNNMVQQLAHECFIRRIGNISFMQDLIPGDLGVFVQLLNCDPQKGAAAGGLAKELEDKGVRTVWVNEKDLASIWAKRPGYQEGVQEGWDNIPSLGLPATPVSRQRDIGELLVLMAEEQSDARYQELGRELMAGYQADPQQVPVLTILEELLRQHQEPERSLPQKEYALFTLDHLADGAADQLLNALESRECEERESIHRVLAALGGKGAYWVIQRICLAEGLFERKSLAAALVALGQAAIAPLVAMLKDERWYVVRNMVAIIGELRCADCVLALKRPLYHHDVRVRKEAVRALMKIGGEASVLLLLPLLDEEDEGVVRHAILSLGLMRSREAVPALLKLLDRRDILLKELGVKKEVVTALGRIGDRRVTPQLLKMLGTRGWPVLGRWLELKVAVASTLGMLGDETAIAALTSLARGSGALAEACREALDAIERISGGTHD